MAPTSSASARRVGSAPRAAAAAPSRQPGDGQAEPDPAVLAPADEVAGLQGGHQPVDHRAADAELGGQLGHGEAAGVLTGAEQLQHGEAAVQRLRGLSPDRAPCTGAGLAGGSGHAPTVPPGGRGDRLAAS